jgi:hypothetical protein
MMCHFARIRNIANGKVFTWLFEKLSQHHVFHITPERFRKKQLHTERASPISAGHDPALAAPLRRA